MKLKWPWSRRRPDNQSGRALLMISVDNIIGAVESSDLAAELKANISRAVRRDRFLQQGIVEMMYVAPELNPSFQIWTYLNNSLVGPIMQYSGIQREQGTEVMKRIYQAIGGPIYDRMGAA